ncbi:MAG: S8 family peptidase, partial [Erythrobacter sp.]|nr:S8 family peptidase [Erythrobacter sp.]
DGPDFHGADVAWGEGFTGTGEIIAVVDSGIDPDSPEFAGRIHPASRDVAGNRGIEAEDDHGTNVSLVAAAARNGQGVLGIAYGAEILAIRADRPGSCAGDTPSDTTLSCRFLDSDIARGVDLAVATGASVVNLSLGGSGITSGLFEAVRRASDAGLVIVVAAGNAGDGSDPAIDPFQPDPFAQALRDAGGANVIIVGSVDDSGTISGFSNRAGDFASSFLTARGERVCCVYQDGEVFVETIDGSQFVTLFSGTSFAAPQVAGAVALLAQAFPNLTGEEIAEILLTTARDAGAGGVDAIYGRGILDIAAAFAPQGGTSLAGTGMMLAAGEDIALGSAAMGDALGALALNTVVLDRYERAYRRSLAGGARAAAQVRRLAGAVERPGFTRAAGGEALALSVTLGETDRAAGLLWSRELRLTPDEPEAQRVLAARVSTRLAPDFKLGFALGQGARGLAQELQGTGSTAGPVFAIAPEAGGDEGFTGSSDLAFAARRTFGEWGVTLLAERGRAWLAGHRRAQEVVFGLAENRATTRLALAGDRSLGGLDARLGLGVLAEEETVLGGHFHRAFGITGADSLFADAALAKRLGHGWSLGGTVRAGITRPRAGALLGEGSQLLTQGWSLDLAKAGAFWDADRIGLRLAQPLRVEGGAMHFDLPVAWDYASESAVIGRQSVSLAPDGREVMGELAWSTPFAIGQGPWGARAWGNSTVSLFYRHQPGHFADAPADVGAVISVSAGF